jgi:hypothetical protein
MRWSHEPADLHVKRLRCTIDGDQLIYKGQIIGGVLCLVLPEDANADTLELSEEALIQGISLSHNKAVDGNRFYGIRVHAPLHKHNGSLGTLTFKKAPRSKKVNADDKAL